MIKTERILISSLLSCRFESLCSVYENYENYEDLKQDENRIPFKLDKTVDVPKTRERIAALGQRQDLKIIEFGDDDYPKLLTEIPDPPPFLFMKGDRRVLANEVFKLAFVGSRKHTGYGKLAIGMLVPDLVEMGVCIVSGLAYGIDGLSHKKVLEEGGKTIGVLGCGVDRIYPAGHRKLYEQVKSNGCIISEYLPWERARSYYFPRRNRIISGLSKGVVVVEAAKKSGSLITARLALEQNRDVFAVPGQINSVTSRGTNDLIKNGAKPATNPDDILEEYSGFLKHIADMKKGRKDPAQDLAPDEEKVFQQVSEGTDDFDELVSSTKIAPADLNYILTMLTLKGLIENNGTKYQRRA